MLQTLSRYSKLITWSLTTLFYVELFLIPICTKAAYYPGNYSPARLTLEKLWASKKFLPVERTGGTNANERLPRITAFKSPAHVQTKFGTGPTQPEMQAFTSVNNNNMVDLFTGDFSYNIPLLDVGGYPVNLVYRAGISMDQEASWVGLGWNINPGTITRNMRGLPDDFTGTYDSIKKVTSVKPNETIGVTGGADLEIVGTPLNLRVSTGVFHNNYKGWGLENSVNASINSGIGAKGPLSGGLSVTNNSQEGVTISPSLSVKFAQEESAENNHIGVGLSGTLSYNSRSGLKSLQLTPGLRLQGITIKNQSSDASVISFATPSYTPTIKIPFTSTQFSFTGKIGGLGKVVHPNYFISGYVSRQFIATADTLLGLPAYGYLHYQDGAKNANSLLDYNREKELVYREKPATPHIAVPVYTYDAFSISGEGTGGMFRAYRGDIGFIHDHFIRTKDESDRLSVDFGTGDLVHGGVDLNVNRAFTQNGPWLSENTLKRAISFRDSTGLFEPVYFRNPGEKAINSQQFYQAVGGDDVVTVDLYQPGISSSMILATDSLTRFRNKRPAGKIQLNPQNAIKPTRDKRSHVISYFTASEADHGGFSKYIDNYLLNNFDLSGCLSSVPENPEGSGTGLPGKYFNGTTFSGPYKSRNDDVLNFAWPGSTLPTGINNYPFSIRWEGRLLAPETGTYTITATSDDGVSVWLNGLNLIDDHGNHGPIAFTSTVNLIAGEFYDLKVEHVNNKFSAQLKLEWAYPGQSTQVIPKQYLYAPPSADTYLIGNVIREKRINTFRKPNHISEIDVLNNDGRRYIYGIPVYNLKQREATFSVNHSDGNRSTGLAAYSQNGDVRAGNNKGKDHYYNSEEIPAYAHSFLLTEILSPDYVDLTGNGVSDDDLGDGIKFHYSKTAGIANPYKWRAPFYTDSVSFNEGLRSDTTDDKGHLVYGEKELWYLHSIESKTMIATFEVENRDDIPAITETGAKMSDGKAKRLKAINLYSKAEFFKDPLNARPIKTVHFKYNYDLCKGVNKPLNNDGKLTLEKVWFTYNGNEKGKQNPYVFHYNSNNPDYSTNAYDRWGNYKDPLQNPGSSGGNTISNDEYPYALQDSLKAAQNAAAWALDSIFLPSGGALKIDYESDDYAYVQDKRAMSMCKIYGLGTSTNMALAVNKLYTGAGDNLYVFISVPKAVADDADVYKKYLEGISKLYFKLYVKMPSDRLGSGYEYVSCYADLDAGNSYGKASSNVIWVKLAGITLKGDGNGTKNYSPLAKAGIQFLRLNLPGKAYPGSEPGDNLSFGDAVKVVFSMYVNVLSSLTSFDMMARVSHYASDIDTSRSFVRLNTPVFMKYGGGHRVKRITIYDNWSKMHLAADSQKTSIYGQEYVYTTRHSTTGATISSGVASYEPGIGSEENPFHVPIEYVEKISPLGPVTLAYSEEPLGESFFPSASVGYSRVRVRTINHKNIKSANGYEESTFYTAYDFPTYTDRTLLDNDTKKRYKPAIANFLRINAKHFISMSQGFKVELNDMHGKQRSQASYAETDPINPITYTENIYRVENPRAEHKRLANTVAVVQPDGFIDTAAVIGKDIELMVDMREQLSITNGYNINLNADLFSIPIGAFIIPSLLNLAQREENQYRSVATVKIIQRYGILDSVIHIDKGSKISTKDILYDSETGSVLLTRTQNEFNDPLYNFTYPSHWAYDLMGHAYKNIGAELKHMTIIEGKLIADLDLQQSVFSSGDEILVAGKLQTGEGDACDFPFSTFPAYTKIWTIDSSVVRGGDAKELYFIDRDGKPYNGRDVTLKIIRSGRRNINAAVGNVTTLKNPLVKNGTTHLYELKLDSTSKVLNAGASEFNQLWKVSDVKIKKTSLQCITYSPTDCENDTSCTCNCLKKFFDFLIFSRRLFTTQVDHVTVGSIVSEANAAGFGIDTSACNILRQNMSGLFYALTRDSVSDLYRAKIGQCTVSWSASTTVNFYQMTSRPCDSLPRVRYYGPSGSADTTYKTFYVTRSMTFYHDPGGNATDISTTKIKAQSETHGVYDYKTLFAFDSVDASTIPAGTQIVSAKLYLYAAPGGYNPPSITNAHSVTTATVFQLGTPQYSWNYSSTATSLFAGTVSTPSHNFAISSSNQDLTVDATSFVNDWIYGSNGNNGMIYRLSGGNLYSAFASQRESDSTKRPKLVIGYLDTVSAILQIESCLACDTVRDTSCNSIVTASTSNPYVTGVLGNFRNNYNYVYYARRAESDPSTATNIRTNGTFADFTPFWEFESSVLKPQYNPARWVWNSQVTMFNKKGFEVENKDPLGRHNAGLYGYNLSLPTAVVQNAQYRESAFDGFEDYGFATQWCDTACPATKHFDFSPYQGKIDTTYSHSGTRSLKLLADEQVGLSFDLTTVEEDTIPPSISFDAADYLACAGTNILSSVHTSSAILTPNFSPFKGRRMVLSAWVKEGHACNCNNYTQNRIVVLFTGGAGSSVIFTPTGNIIEGWQRYESVFDIPEDATSMTVSLESTDTSTVYFDDLRIHPFNANMKSFVYNPVNLRLMAELDENNYTTFYEYDDEGTLIRVKKETERGIKTIKETRSALFKPLQ